MEKYRQIGNLCITINRADYKSLYEAFGISCIIGYPLLVNDYMHYTGLAEGSDFEVQRFFVETAARSRNGNP